MLPISLALAGMPLGGLLPAPELAPAPGVAPAPGLEPEPDEEPVPWLPLPDVGPPASVWPPEVPRGQSPSTTSNAATAPPTSTSARVTRRPIRASAAVAGRGDGPATRGVRRRADALPIQPLSVLYRIGRTTGSRANGPGPVSASVSQATTNTMSAPRKYG